MLRLWAMLFSAVCLLSGCGSGGATGSVTGEISFNGIPLNSGIIAFHYPDGNVANGGIQDGRYTIPKAPVGSVQIAVQVPSGGSNPGMVPTGTKTGGMVAPPPIAIPAIYGKPETSGLTYTVVSGPQTYPLTLK